MISLDTNVMVRILVDDPQCPEQNSKARQIVSEYETVYVTQIVQVETVWVLSRAYGFSRADIERVMLQYVDGFGFFHHHHIIEHTDAGKQKALLN